MTSYKLCALIPTYNHATVLPEIIARLTEAHLAILIVDDGSDQHTKKTLRILQNQYPKLQILTLSQNLGKGAAIRQGLYHLNAAGYTHAFQLDADGQHALDTLEHFLALSKKNPHALVSGKPVYDASMPLSRRIGRWFTHVWVWIETLSFQITDSMCGFRVYPIAPTISVLQKQTVGQRMDFDTEIMVRLFWQGMPVIMHPIQVIYPVGNISHFKMFADNWRITKMHTRLFFGMLKRLPRLLFKRSLKQEISLWASMQERGTFIGLFILAKCYRLFGRSICLAVMTPVVGYFYLTGVKQKKASYQFLSRVFAYTQSIQRPTALNVFKHFMSFAEMALDKFVAWTGGMSASQIGSGGLKQFESVMHEGKGGVFLISHLGNIEFCRAVSYLNHKQRLHVLLHTKNSKRYNRILKKFSPDSQLNIIEVTEVNPSTIIYLKERVDSGDWIVIAADRVPVTETTRTVRLPFLGREALFSQGPYILASLLQCEVYTTIAVKENSQFKVYVDLFAEKIVLDKKTREADIKDYALRYAKYLEHYCLLYPYQWFNFFDFWEE